MAVANETVEQGMWNCAWRRTVNTPTSCIWNICYMLSLIWHWCKMLQCFGWTEYKVCTTGIIHKWIAELHNS